MLNNKTLETNLGKLRTLQLKTTEPNLKWPKRHISNATENGPDTVQYTVWKEGSRKLKQRRRTGMT